MKNLLLQTAAAANFIRLVVSYKASRALRSVDHRLRRRAFTAARPFTVEMHFFMTPHKHLWDVIHAAMGILYHSGFMVEIADRLNPPAGNSNPNICFWLDIPATSTLEAQQQAERLTKAAIKLAKVRSGSYQKRSVYYGLRTKTLAR